MTRLAELRTRSKLALNRARDIAAQVEQHKCLPLATLRDRLERISRELNMLKAISSGTWTPGNLARRNNNLTLSQLACIVGTKLLELKRKRGKCPLSLN